jgi:hydroxyacylglutathione hydrolase
MGNKHQGGIVAIPLGRANAYLVISEQQAVLIDTGIKGNAQKIVQALQSLHLSPKDIRLIILTHTHYDHCGSLEALKVITDAKCLVHENEAARLREGYGGFPKGTTPLTKVISLLGRAIGKRLGGYEPVSPDITVKDHFGLEEYGLDGYVLATPGHTKGSISVILNNKHAMVGDTLFNIFRRSLFPPFADDPDELLKSWRKLYETGCEDFYPGHGRPFQRDKFRLNLEARMKG